MCSSALFRHSGTQDNDYHPQHVASKFTMGKSFLTGEERERTEIQGQGFALKQGKSCTQACLPLSSMDGSRTATADCEGRWQVRSHLGSHVPAKDLLLRKKHMDFGGQPVVFTPPFSPFPQDWSSSKNTQPRQEGRSAATGI